MAQTYEAEWATFTSRKINRRMAVDDARIMVRRYLPGWRVKVTHDGSNAWCYCDERLIEIGSRSPMWIVAHEIAHGLADKAGAPPGHHDSFRHFYAEVVGSEIGPYWEKKLRGQFQQKRLGVGHPVERPTPRLWLFLVRMRQRVTR